MIRLENIHKEYIYNGEIEFTLGPINTELGNSGLIFLMGPSGCGKTTLLNILGCIDNEYEGKAWIDKINISGLEDKTTFRNFNIGYVFQDFNLFENKTVYENIVLTYQIQNKKISKEEICSLLSKVGIFDIDKKVKNLSGGQKQRVAIIRAMVKNPKIIICDEPTGALDEKTGFEVLDILKEISNSALVIVASHDQKAAEKYADRIITLNDGKIESDLIKNKCISKNIIELNFDERKPSRSLIFQKGLENTFKKPFFLLLSLIIGSISISMSSLSSCISYESDNEKIANYYLEHKYNYLMYEKNVVICDENGEVKTASNGSMFSTDEYDEFLVNHPNACFISNRFYSIESYDNSDSFVENKWYQNTINGYCEIDKNNFDNFKFDLLAGRLPSNENEVAITSFIFEHFKQAGYKNGALKIEHPTFESLLNKTLNIRCNPKSNVSLKIVGIVDTKMDTFYDIEHFDEHNYAYNQFPYYLRNSLDNVLFVSKGFHKTLDPDFINGPFETKYNNHLVKLSSDTKTYYLDTIEKKSQTSYTLVDFKYMDSVSDRGNEVYVSLNTFLNNILEAKTNFYSLLNEVGCVGYNGNLPFGNINTIQGLYDVFDSICVTYGVVPLDLNNFKNQYFNSFGNKNIFDNFNITGLKQINSILFSGIIDGCSTKNICASDSLVNNLLNDLKQTYNPFVNFVDTMPTTKGKLLFLLDEADSRFYYNSRDDIFGEEVFYLHTQINIGLFIKDTLKSNNNVAHITKTTLLIVGICFTVLSFLFLLYYFYTILKNEIKQFGILKCLGIKNNELFGIFAIHSALTGLLLFVSSTFVLMGEIFILNCVLNLSSDFLSLQVSFLSILIMLTVSLIGTIVCNIIPLIKTLKMNIIETLKCNE